MFQLLDRRSTDTFRVAMDKPYRRQLRRYEPEKDRDRPGWWHDAAPSYAQEAGEAGRRFREANMPLSRLHATERALFRDCHAVARALERHGSRYLLPSAFFLVLRLTAVLTYSRRLV